MSRTISKIFTVLFVTSFLWVPSFTAAQDTDQAKPAVVEKAANPENETSNLLANWRGLLQSTEQSLTRQGLRDEELAQNASEAAIVRINALELEKSLESPLASITSQLEQLGPAPKEGEPPESETIAKQRKTLEDEFALIDGQIKESRLVATRARQIERTIVENRRQRFVRELTVHSHSIFDVSLWQKWAAGFSGLADRFGLLVRESANDFISRINNQPRQLGGLVFLIGLATLAFLLVRRIARRKLNKINSKKLSSNDAFFHKPRVAGLDALYYGLLPALLVLIIFRAFSHMGLLTKRIDILASDLAMVAALLILSGALAKAFLSPYNEEKRIVNLSDDNAMRVWRLTLTTLIVSAILWAFNKTAIALVSPFEVSIGTSAIFAFVIFLASIRLLTIVASDELASQPVRYLRRNLIRWGYINPLLWLVCSTGLLALASGYIAFGEFLAQQILLVGLVLSITWLVIEFFDRHRTRFQDEKTGGWRKLSRTTGFSKQTVMQGAVFGFGLAKLIGVFIALFVFMASWGYRTGDWSGIITEAFFGFKIGGLTISISSIVLAVLLFIAGYTVTRAIQHWLRIQFFPTTNMDTGLRNSIATVFGYAGIVLAALLAITAAGLDLSKVAIVAGALSVGIGFGLQSIVNNFVSGLILLAERPIKTGDWIITGGGQGTVKKTSVRSTEIETFDGATVIVPNSTLITDPVTNMTHTDQNGRIIVPIGVGYDSDPDQVRDILLGCAKAHDLVVEDPSPRVFFQDFGNDALVFELRAYLDDINFGMSVKSDLRFEILRALRNANIEIPFPQRDLHIKSIPDGLQDKSARKTSTKQTTTRRKKPRETPIAQEVDD